MVGERSSRDSVENEPHLLSTAPSTMGHQNYFNT